MSQPRYGAKTGGGKGIRTPGLFIANEALYQLSYTPQFAGVMLTSTDAFSRIARLGAVFLQNALINSATSPPSWRAVRSNNVL